MFFLWHHFILVDLAQEQNYRHVSPFFFLSQSILTINLLLLSLDTIQKRCFELGNSYRFIPAIFGNKLNLQGKLVHTSCVGYPWISPLIPIVICKTHLVWAVWRPVFGPKNAQHEDFNHENGGTTIAVSSAELDQTVYCVYMYA